MSAHLTEFSNSLPFLFPFIQFQFSFLNLNLLETESSHQSDYTLNILSDVFNKVYLWESGADTAHNLMGRSPKKIGLDEVWAAGGSARGRNFFFGDRLGYPAISMNFKTESFTYVILLIFTHFVISLSFKFLLIG